MNTAETAMSETQPQLSPLKRALIALEDAEERIRVLREAAHAPIAIVGIGCRVPGADGPDAMWQFLEQGIDATGPVPADRWDHDRIYDPDPDREGTVSTRRGGFIDRIDEFDAGLFGISMREARSMDPQQRLMLQTAWAALEHAGIAPDSLQGSPTGVFFGATTSDYTYLQIAARDPALLDAHFSSGIAHSVISGRLSYFLGLQGPSVTVDTACSSSLVAVHQAVQSLRRGESRLALAGGVSLMISPEIFIALSRAHMLAPDGRCKTFDASADGFARAEGCGVVVLKTLADAQADGDRVLAVLRGSALNQDGPSSSLTAPSGPAQEAVIRAALADAGISPADLGYLEAHGTGTNLGDPQEMQALGNVFAGRETPLVVGSVKTNLGHLEGAAGVTGLIKLALMLRAGRIPRHLHFRTPSPHIPWSSIPVRIPVETEPFQPVNGRRFASVSSFGFSGTNAHVVLEEAPALPSAASEDGPALVALSAASADSLRELASDHAARLAGPSVPSLGDLCRTANAGRAQLAYRATVAGSTLSSLREGFAEIASGLAPIAGPVRETPRVAFLFTGQGAQFAGMGRELYDRAPVFRDVLDCAARHLEGRLEAPLLDVMFGTGGETGLLDQTGYTQPALFAFEHALTALWSSWGVEPDVVIGHSVGEFAAACAAGVLSFEDALDLVAERGRLMNALPSGGGMLSVAAPETALLRHLCGDVGIAAVNAPNQTVLSGPVDALDRIAAALTSEGMECRRLPVSHAFHSGLVDPVLDAFEAKAAGIAFGTPNLRLISNLTGKRVDAATIGSPTYWRRHMREAVRFADGAAELGRLSTSVLIEIGPQPVLTALARETLEAQDASGHAVFVASLRRGRGEWEQVQAALGELWKSGVRVDWKAVETLRGGRVADIPTYPFARDRHWISVNDTATRDPARSQRLFGDPMPVALDARIWDGVVTAGTPGWVGDHVVNGRVIVPGAALVAMMAAAEAQTHGSGPQVALEDVVIEASLAAKDDGSATDLQTVCRDGEVSVFSKAAGNDAWLRHATARAPETTPELAADPIGAAEGETVDVPALYEGLASRGIALGPAFQVMESLRVAPDALVGQIALPEGIGPEPGLPIHPLLLDGCLQLVAAAPATRAAGDGAFLPFAIDRVVLGADPGRRLRARAQVRAAGPDLLIADIRAEAEDGRPVLSLTGLRLRRVASRPALTASGAPLSEALYTMDWVTRPTLPSAQDLVTSAAAGAGKMADAAGLEAYDQFILRMEAACVDFLRDTFAQLGWRPAPGETFEEEALAKRLGIADVHRRLFGRLLRILEESSDIGRHGTGWKVLNVPPTSDRARIADELRRLAPPAALPEVEILVRASAGLDEALCGRADPLELLFPGGDTRTAESLYSEVPTSVYFNGMIAEILAEMTKGERPLRILEVGGGTGGTTGRVTERLPAGTEYTFTDVGPSFVERARERFGGRPGMGFQVLDLERDLVEQGIESGSIDVVIGANVVHATRDLAATLGRIRRVMAPGGRLVMLEVTTAQRWFDLTVGLTPGWWAYSDTHLRSDGPLLDRQTWLGLLETSGFASPAALDGDPALTGSRGRQAVLVAGADGGQKGRWLVLPDTDDLGVRLSAALCKAGVTAELPMPGERAGGALERLASAGTLPDHVVVLGGAERKPAQGRVVTTLDAVQAVARHAPHAQVTLVTRGAEQIGNDRTAPRAEEAAVAGLARSFALELPDLGCRRIDIDSDSDDPAPLAQALLAAGDEPELAIRDAECRVARLTHWSPEAASEAPTAPWRLANAAPGTLERLERQPLARRSPGPGEIEIEVEVAGLNFRDVLNALGEYPGAPPLGGECAGRVSAIGDGVTGFEVGDAVVGMAPGALASHLTVPAALAAPLPDGFDMRDGAAFAIPFVTADYCLRELGKLGPGERVLIHAAAGGVGMAAVQIALAAGADVFATAGTEEKRAIVRGLGVAHVMDSRSPAFVEEVLEATGGRGVDLVLNSLTGEMADASLRSLAEGGRMIELGVRDLRDPTDLAHVAPGIRYEPVNWGTLAEQDPESIGPVLQRVTAELAAGRLTPLPRQCFGIDTVQEAFRLMARAGHVGKIVVEIRPQSAAPTRRAGTYLVTGGLTGLGFDTVQRLAGEGAGRIVATGRRGPSAEADAAIAALRAQGARIDTRVVDVSDAAAMAALLAEIRREGPPIRGVFHAAGTLSDAGILSQDAQTVAAVMAAKVEGTLLLERLTRGDPLDVFCAYSSLAALLGSPAQSNHAAANAALGAIMRGRASQGLPGLAIAWGPWSGIGAAADAATIARLAEQGIAALSPAEGRAACGYLVAEAHGEVAVAPIDWMQLNAWRGGNANPVFPTGPRIEVSTRQGAASTPPSPTVAAASDGTDDVLKRIESAPPERKRATLDAFLEATVRKSFALPEGRKLDPETPFGELGLDSLLAIELRNRLGRSLGLRLPATLLFENPTLATLGDALIAELVPEDPADPTPDSTTSETDIFAGLDDLSEEELERLLGVEGTGSDRGNA